MSIEVDLSEYVAAGYMIARPVVRPAWADARYVADPIVSCSAGLLGGGAGPETLCAASERNLADLGVAPSDEATARAFVAEHEQFVDFLGVWSSPEPLLVFMDRFLPQGSAMVIGLALPAERARQFVGDPADAMEQLLANGDPPAPGGTPLGWEPVEWLEQGPCASWTVNGLQRMVAERMELRLTDDGLLPDQAHTDQVMVVVEDLPKEPSDWEAFLLIRYGPPPTGPYRELPPVVCRLTEPEPGKT